MAKKKNVDIEIAANDTEVVAKCDHLVPMTQIEEMIITLRGVQVIVDRDLAMLYGEETKVMNQAIKRNIERFPERFRFQLTDEETDELVTNCDRLSSLKHSSSNPFVFLLIRPTFWGHFNYGAPFFTLQFYLTPT